MEEVTQQQPLGEETHVPPVKKEKEKLPEVLTVRNWKEYLGESVLIIFSVLLALIFTEYFNSLHEKQKTNEVVQQLREELIKNKQAEELQYAYYRQVLKNIDSTLDKPEAAKKFIDSGVLHLDLIAPQGVVLTDLNDVAWQVAKQNDIVAKIDLDTYSMLTTIYAYQLKITNVEAEVGKVILSYESRKPENVRTTLLLIKDNYRGWAVDRVPKLLGLYQQAIDRLGKY